MIETASKRQKRLSKLLKATSGTIRIDDAISALELDRKTATRLLADWNRQGVIRRVAHGLYVPIQPSALGQTQVLDDPWILVPELYEPGYIGGWSALEHWGLTEQVFRTICVLTNKKTSYGDKKLQGVNFFIKYIPEKNLFGTKTLWHDHTKIRISDPHKTILDIVDEPRIGGGLQHTFDCFKEYLKNFGEDERLNLINYAIRLGNGALFKKIGYLGELAGIEDRFLRTCKEQMTEGYTYLDKDIKNKKLITRWKLWIPESWVEGD